MNVNVYDTIIKFVTEVAKAADVDSVVTNEIMMAIQAYNEQYPQSIRTELLCLLNNVEHYIRKNTNAFVSFEIFPNIFTAIVIRNHGQMNEEQVTIICPMEGEMRVVQFKSN